MKDISTNGENTAFNAPELLYLPYIDPKPIEVYTLAFFLILASSYFISQSLIFYSVIPIILLNITGVRTQEQYIINMLNLMFIISVVLNILLVFVKN
ncbi:hypothetical protein COBT_002214 [Conglomerata obtusa]